MELVVPCSLHAKSFEEALKEREGADHVFGFDPWVARQAATTADYIRVRNDHAKGENLPEGWVPSSTYWLIEGDDFIGETNIRHKLTPSLRVEGGHIGYWIRPSRRRHGYGKRILHLALLKTRELGLSRVLVTCDETNDASRKIIEENGGVFETANSVGEGKPRKLLYWIMFSFILFMHMGL